MSSSPLNTEEKDDFPVGNAISVSLVDAYERAKVDINFFAALCMPTVCIYQLPPFYVAVWKILADRDIEVIGKILRFALGLPRSHAKTTFIKVLIAWLIVYDKASFILIVCANSDLAENLLADIHDILSSDNITAIYGNWTEMLAIDSADTKKGSYHSRSVTLVARGWAAGIRGINLKNERPDVIFCDDVQTKKNDESHTERTTLLQELVGSIFKSIRPLGNRLIIYVGNMYSEECILMQLKKNPLWMSMITGAILSNKQPLWPELFSLQELMEGYYHDEALGLAHVWFAEVMNDPKSIALSLLNAPLPPCPLEEVVSPDGVFLTIDPAGFRKTSDDNVIAVHYKFEDKGFVVKTVKGILDPQELIKNALSLAIEHNASVIGIEETGYQQTLGFWMQHFINEWRIEGIQIVPLSPHGRSKESRIRLFILELYNQSYYLLDHATRSDFVWQASMYKIGKKDNKDDLLDAVAYGLDMRNEYWHLITTARKTSVIEGQACRVVADNTPF